MYERLFSQNYSKEERNNHEDNSYAHSHTENFPSSILSSLELTSGRF
jgi:hypothetical protein